MCAGRHGIGGIAYLNLFEGFRALLPVTCLEANPVLRGNASTAASCFAPCG